MDTERKVYPSLKSQLADIVALLKGRNGKMRSTRPQAPAKDMTWEARVLRDRAYYVWRLARFHGGKDVTMPVMANIMVHGDPELKGLDEMAEWYARKEFGTDMAAAIRWSRVLG